jgi:hypothetical protein
VFRDRAFIGHAIADRGRVRSLPNAGGEGGQVMRIVLVHGAWADGSSWAAVIRRLQAVAAGS